MMQIRILSAMIVISALSLLPGCKGPWQEPNRNNITQIPTTPTKQTQSPIPDQAKTTPKAQPKLKIENPVHDFGVIGPATRNTCVFRFKNVGDATLVISKVTATCGCTVPQLKKKKYEPDETGEITVVYRAGSYAASVNKHLYILSNDPANPRAELAIKATIKLKVTVKPDKLELYLKKDNAGAKPITVKSSDGKPFAIKSVTSTANAITAKYDPKAEATEFTLPLKVDKDKLAKNLTGAVRLTLSHPECKSIAISYTAQPCIVVSNQKFVLPDAVPGKTITRSTIIKSNCSQEIRIVSAESLKNYMKVVSQETQGNTIKLEIQITPPPRPNKVRRYISDRLKFRFDTGDTAEISLSGWYKIQ